MKKQILSILKVTLLATVLSFGISYALAWTAPTAPPPGGNVYAPINTSTTPQEKLGDLTVTKLISKGDVCATVLGVSKCLSDVQLMAPKLAFSANPSIIQEGTSSTLSWLAVKDATTCSLMKPDGTSVSANVSGGSFSTGNIFSGQASSALASKFYTYSLICTWPGGAPVTQTAIVTVLAPYSISYTNGTFGSVSIPAGVAKLTFSGNGGSACDLGGTTVSGTGAGLGGSYYGTGQARAGSGTAGTGGAGNRGAGDAAAGGAGGIGMSSGASGVSGVKGPIPGIGFTGYGGPGGGGGMSGVGTASSGQGGSSGYNGISGGGGAYAFIGAVTSPNIIIYLGGAGGCAYTSYSVFAASGGGGGGGYGGGGGGGGTNRGSTGGYGGGGGSFSHPKLTAPSVSGRSILLSDLGLTAPTAVNLGSGAAGYSSSGQNGTAGVITMSW